MLRRSSAATKSYGLSEQTFVKLIWTKSAHHAMIAWASDRRLQDAHDMDATRLTWPLGLLCAVCLAFVVVYNHQQALGLEYLRTVQMERLERVAEGTAPTPWQYRVATDTFVYALADSYRSSGGDPAVPLLAIRIVQQTLVGFLLLLLYRQMGLGSVGSLLGLTLYSLSCFHAIVNSDLSFNTHSDVAVYAAFCLFLLRRQFFWAFAVAAFGAFNRETSGLLAALAIVPLVASFGTDRARITFRSLPADPHIRLACAVAVVWLAVFVGLRLHYGIRPWSYWPIPAPGLPVLTWNLIPRNLLPLLMTLTLLPLFALWAASRRLWRFPVVASLVFLSVWFPVHFLVVLTNESRIFLVPIAVAFIPTALILFQAEAAAVESDGHRRQSPRRRPSIAEGAVDHHHTRG